MTPARRIKRIDRLLLAGSGTALAVILAGSLGLITLPGVHAGTQSAQASYAAARAAQRAAADRRWASAACTNVLSWKDEIHHDATSLNLGFGALARIHDAATATSAMLKRVDALGWPPSAQTGRARADLQRLRSELDARVRATEGDAQRVTSGSLGAIPSLVSDLEGDRALAPRLAGEVRRVVSVDLGLSLAETRACRRLVGIPV